MPLVDQPFDDTFTFARPTVTRVRSASGKMVTIGIDVPRFDHDSEGTPLGLLVDPGATLGQADRCRVVAGDWEVVGPATVLHEISEADGTVIRRAVYTHSVRTAVDAMLAIAGHHRIIAAVPGFLFNRGGHVRYREFDWTLPTAIGTGTLGEAIGDGTPTDRALIEG